MSIEPPVIIFGAFDRHNFGDLLFPHIVAALLPGRECLFAGLADRDLRPWGGHLVTALPTLATQWRDRPVDLLHAGGEILSCDVWEAAVMLLPQEQAQQAMTDRHVPLDARRAWAQQLLGQLSLAPYVAPRGMFPKARRVIFNAVGGTELVQRDAAFRADAVGKLKDADAIGVRDMRTQAVLRQAGIDVQLLPDPAVMVAELFGEGIKRHTDEGETATVRATFPQGYIAVQCSADFGDDATLRAMAAQLDGVAASTGYGIVFFRAGAAPWHDDLSCYARLSGYMQCKEVRVFDSLHLWDICALIAASRAYLGSSLHGRIVAMAYGLPRLNLLHPGYGSTRAKQVAYAATWDADMPGCVGVQEMVDGMRRALATSAAARGRKAAQLAQQYRNGFLRLLEG